MKKSIILLSAAALLSLAACGGHTHTFASEWTFDDTNHWHAATCEHTDQKDGVAAHTIGADGKCTVCDYTIPKDNKVTKEEWEAAFGLDKPYYMADNYNAITRLIMEDETEYTSLYSALQVDGLKAKMTNKEVCSHEEEQFYEKVNNVYNAYLYGQKRQNKWDLFEDVSNPARNFANFLEPIVGTYSSFTYSQNDSTYKCVSLDYEGTILTNINIKFIDKKVVSCSFDSVWGVGTGSPIPFHWTFEITYGGQTVTLPEIDPEPSGEEYRVTENQFNAAFSLEGLSNVTITTSSGSFSQTCEADGTKEFNVNMKSYDFYLSLEDGIMYEYKQEDSEWVKNQRDGTTFSREDMIKMFGNVYNQLAFDDDSNSYKGTNISIEGAVRYSEVEYCFENLKVVAIHAIGATGSAAGQSMTVNFAKYGQTIVTLPEVVPPGPDADAKYKVTSEQYDAAISVDAFYNVTIDSGVDGFYKFDGDYIESLDVDGHVSMVKNGEKYHVYFDNDGEWVDTETETDDLRDAICSLFYFGYENLTYNSVDKCYDLTDPEILKYYNAEIAHEYFEDGKFVRFTAVMSGIEREMLIIDYGTTVADHPVIEG